MELLLSECLPFELTNGNEGRTKHFGKSARDRKKYALILRQIGKIRQPFDVPVTVLVTRILGKGQRFWDGSSVGRGNYKEIEDSLVECGWFVDDSYKWIRHTDFRQDDSKRMYGPRVLVEVFSLNEKVSEYEAV